MNPEQLIERVKSLGPDFHHVAAKFDDAMKALEVAQREQLDHLREMIKRNHEQIAKWEAERARLEAQTGLDLLRAVMTEREEKPGEPSPNRFDCEECGTGVSADEDGCCATCGRTCWIWINGECVECVLAGGSDPEELPSDPPSPADPFVPGLPPLRLREVWAEWEDHSGDVCVFRAGKYRWKQNPAGEQWWDVGAEHTWRDNYRPHGKTRAEVEAMADERENQEPPALLDLRGLKVGTVCELTAAAWPFTSESLSPGEHMKVIEQETDDYAGSLTTRVELSGDRIRWLNRMQPARVVEVPQ